MRAMKREKKKEKTRQGVGNKTRVINVHEYAARAEYESIVWHMQLHRVATSPDLLAHSLIHSFIPRLIDSLVNVALRSSMVDQSSVSCWFRAAQAPVKWESARLVRWSTRRNRELGEISRSCVNVEEEEEEEEEEGEEDDDDKD